MRFHPGHPLGPFFDPPFSGDRPAHNSVLSLQGRRKTAGGAARKAWSGVDRMSHDRAWVLKNIIETIPYLVFWKDRNSNYLGCNEGFARAAGLNTSDDIVGKNDFELPWKKEETEWFRAWDRRVIESGIPE